MAPLRMACPSRYERLIRIIINDDRELFRFRVGTLPNGEFDQELEREFATGTDAPSDAKDLREDVAAVNELLPYLVGLEVRERISDTVKTSDLP